MVSNLTCMFQTLIAINSASFMKSGEISESVKNSFCFIGPVRMAFFFFKILTSDTDSNKVYKFHEFRRTFRKCENFIKYLRFGADNFFCQSFLIFGMTPNLMCLFLMLIPLHSASLMKFGKH